MPAPIIKHLDQTIFLSIENRKDHVLKLLTSGLYFAVTFIALHYIGHAWTTSNAYIEGYAPLFSYAGVDSLLGTSGWTARKIGFIYLMPAVTGIIALFVGLISMGLAKTKWVHFRTFMFWLSLNGLLMYASYISTGFISGLNFSSKFFTGLVGFYAWLYWEKTTIYGVLILQALLCIPIILYFSRLVMGLNYSSSLIKQMNGRIIVWSNLVLIPFMIGVVMVMAATFPMDLGYQAVRIVTFVPISVLILVGMYLFSAKNISVIKGGITGLPVLFWALATGLLLFIARTVLSISTGPLW